MPYLPEPLGCQTEVDRKIVRLEKKILYLKSWECQPDLTTDNVGKEVSKLEAQLLELKKLKR